MQEERKERQERRRWMQDEDVHIVSFITALKFLVFFFWCKRKTLYKPKMTGQEQLKRRNAAPSSFMHVIVGADFIL